MVHVKEETESETESEDDDKHGDSDDSDDDSVDSNLVDVPSVHAPTKSDFPDEPEDDGPKPWEVEHREGANFVEEEVPDFDVGVIEKPDVPEPVLPAVQESSEALNGGDGDIWGAYLAKWKKPAQVAPVKPVAPVRPTHYYGATPVAFDAAHYLKRSRELAPEAGTVGNNGVAAQGWWDAEEEQDPWQAEEPWWEAMSQGYANDNGYKVKKTNFVPNSTYVARSS